MSNQRIAARSAGPMETSPTTGSGSASDLTSLRDTSETPPTDSVSDDPTSCSTCSWSTRRQTLESGEQQDDSIRVNGTGPRVEAKRRSHTQVLQRCSKVKPFSGMLSELIQQPELKVRQEV